MIFENYKVANRENLGNRQIQGNYQEKISEVLNIRDFYAKFDSWESADTSDAKSAPLD